LTDNERKNPMTKDFILYIRDDRVNNNIAISSINEHGEECILISMLPDLRKP